MKAHVFENLVYTTDIEGSPLNFYHDGRLVAVVVGNTDGGFITIGMPQSDIQLLPEVFKAVDKEYREFFDPEDYEVERPKYKVMFVPDGVKLKELEPYFDMSDEDLAKEWGGEPIEVEIEGIDDVIALMQHMPTSFDQ